MLDNIKPNDPLVCITRFKDDGINCHGLSIRLYAGKDNFGVNKVHSHQTIDGMNSSKMISFTEFIAIVPLKEFNWDKPLINYISNYKVR